VGEPSLDDFRRAYLGNAELFNDHEFGRVFSAFPARFEWWTFDGILFGRGPEAVARAFAELVEGLEDWRVDPQEFAEVGAGTFLINCTGHGTGRMSGAASRVNWFQLWELENGLPVRVSEFRDRDAALAAAR
jgi:hypothetical protein